MRCRCVPAKPEARGLWHCTDHLLIHPNSLFVLTDTKTDRRVERLHLLRELSKRWHRPGARVAF